MTQHLDRPVVCPVLIGRAPHIEIIDGYLRQVVDGSSQTLLISGEAGVGKSRLVGETRERADRLGITVLEGKCFEAHRTLPYGPLIDLLRSAVSREDPAQLAHAIGSGASGLTRLLP